MKKSIFLLGFVFSFVVFASKPRTGISDLADSRGTGVENVQFLFGGEDQAVLGLKAKDVMAAFRSNILGQYRCFSAIYGGQSKATGVIYVRATVPSGQGEVTPSQVQVDSKEFDSPEFMNCLKSHWSRMKLPAAAMGETATIVMPIHAQLRE